MAEIYKIKDNYDMTNLIGMGFLKSPDAEFYFMASKQDIESPHVKALLERVYEDPKWKADFYKPNKGLLKKNLGLSYHKNGKARMTKKFVEILTTWVIQIDGSDGWVGITPYDPGFPKVWYAKEALDGVCPKEIDKLILMGAIEISEVE